MNYLGVDYGEKRIGLAFGDELGVACPLPAATAGSLEERLRQIQGVIEQRRIDALVIGYPYNMDGSVGFKAREVDVFIAELEKRFALPVHRSDERLTTSQARAVGKPSGRKHPSLKKVRKERASGHLDSRSAAIILQDFLEERLQSASARPLGPEDLQ